jgi:Arm DNA-binding domain
VPNYLTEVFVKSARAETQRAEYRDAHTRGLVLRVTPNGAKTWAVVYRRRSDSRRRRYAIGAYPTISLTEASTCIGYEDESTQYQKIDEGLFYKANCHGSVHFIPDRGPQGTLDNPRAYRQWC